MAGDQLMSQTEEKKTKWSEAALSSFLSSLNLALCVCVVCGSLLPFLPLFLSRDVRIKIHPGQILSAGGEAAL